MEEGYPGFCGKGWHDPGLFVGWWEQKKHRTNVNGWLVTHLYLFGALFILKVVFFAFLMRTAPRTSLTDVTLTVNSAWVASRHTRGST